MVLTVLYYSAVARLCMMLPRSWVHRKVCDPCSDGVTTDSETVATCSSCGHIVCRAQGISLHD